MTVRPMFAVLLALGLGACATSAQLVDSRPCGKDGWCRPVGGYALPKALVGVQISVTDEASTIEFPDTDRPIAPDEWIPLSYHPMDASDDEVSVEIENGYLKSVKATADDKTDEIITEIIKILGLPGQTGGTTPGSLLATAGYRGYVDPLSLDDVARFNAAVSRFGLCVESPQAISDAASRQLADVARGGAAGAVWYRPTVSAPVRVHSGDCQGPVVKELALTLPGRAVAPILISRAAFVKSETEITFASGQLQKVTIKKPSSSQAVATFPYTILKGLVALPSQLIQLKIDTSGKEKALINAQKDEAVARTELLGKLVELKAAQAAGSNAPKPDGDAAGDAP